jgi:hypothetical protein
LFHLAFNGGIKIMENENEKIMEIDFFDAVAIDLLSDFPDDMEDEEFFW